MQTFSILGKSGMSIIISINMSAALQLSGRPPQTLMRLQPDTILYTLFSVLFLSAYPQAYVPTLYVINIIPENEI
jgi:hypothetical protein